VQSIQFFYYQAASAEEKVLEYYQGTTIPEGKIDQVNKMIHKSVLLCSIL